MALANPFDDKTYQQIGAFLADLGLLTSSKPARAVPAKVSLLDILKVGNTIEPRFLAVLPAALLRAPERITKRDHLPAEFQVILENLRSGRTSGPSAAGIPYEEFYRWALHPFADKRRKPVPLKKSMKSFRLSPKAFDVLKSLASLNNQTETEIVEELILAASPNPEGF